LSKIIFIPYTQFAAAASLFSFPARGSCHVTSASPSLPQIFYLSATPPAAPVPSRRPPLPSPSRMASCRAQIGGRGFLLLRRGRPRSSPPARPCRSRTRHCSGGCWWPTTRGTGPFSSSLWGSCCSLRPPQPPADLPAASNNSPWGSCRAPVPEDDPAREVEPRRQRSSSLLCLVFRCGGEPARVSDALVVRRSALTCRVLMKSSVPSQSVST
jgi:hypothetical protein